MLEKLKLWETICEGKLFMIPLMTCSVLSLGVIIERLFSLKAAEVDTTGLRSRIAGLMRANRTKEAVMLCESTPGPIASILGVGLRKFQFLSGLGRSEEVVEEGVVKSMEDYAVHVVSQLERFLVILATIGNVAPLFGFAGTVTGMIGAFDKIREAGGMDPSLVAGGISEALVTTAGGLLIAIPAVIFFNYFTTRVQNFVLDIEASAAHLIEVVAIGQAEGEAEPDEEAAESADEEPGETAAAAASAEQPA